jgi:hypothetical protein
MLRLINVRVNSDKSITITNPIQLRQGDVNVVKLVINASLYLEDYTNLLGFISFKRPDNKQTGQLLLTREPDNTFTYVIKDPWIVDISGQLWFTISFDKIARIENGTPIVQERMYSGNSSLYIHPDANYTVGNYLPPNDTEAILSLINEVGDKVSILEEQLPEKLNKDFTTYPKLDWDSVEDTDLVVLNRVDANGNVTQYNAEAKDLYNTVNEIMPNEEGNIELDANDIPYDNTNVGLELERLETKKININEKVVYYEEIADINEPVITVTRADFAVADEDGRNIVDTYSTKEETENQILNVNTSITNINTSIGELETDISNLDTNKQDNISVNNSLNFSNNELSLNKNYTASELIFNGTINNTSSNASTMSTATFTPTHLLIIYNDYAIRGGTIVDLNGEFRSSDCRLDSYQYGGDNDNYQQSYYDLNIIVNYSTRKIYGSSKWTTLYYSHNSGITGVNQSTNGINVKVYAINI